jgi:hypothetical protein
MRCPTARTLLTCRMRETIPPFQERCLARHLSRCPSCRAEDAATTALVARLGWERPVAGRASLADVVDARAIADLLRRDRLVTRGWAARVRAGVGLALAGVAAAAVVASLVAARAPGRHEGVGRAESDARRRPSRGLLEGDGIRALSGPVSVMEHATSTRTRIPADDLAYLNPSPRISPSGPLADGVNRSALKLRLGVPKAPPMEKRAGGASQTPDDFITIPLPRIAAAGAEGDRTAAEAAASYRRERAVTDARLARRVTLGVKATALSDLCDRFHEETGIQLAAGRSVADEKVTLFCREMPLRDVMRQISRPFGYTWLRSGKESAYRYELVQDLRSQLMEEELRNRDRNAALIALDEELTRFRAYLDLSPDEALARARKATGKERQRLEQYATWGWGPTQLYFRLSPADLAALRAGARLTFSGEPLAGEQPLPPDLARGVLQSARDKRLQMTENGFVHGWADALPNGLPPVQVPEARGRTWLQIDQSDLGRMTFVASSGISWPAPGAGGGRWMQDGWLAQGESPSVRSPQNAEANRMLAGDPALRPRVTVEPQPAYRPDPATRAPGGREPGARGYMLALPDQPMVTTAEVLEAIHRATGLPLVADYYTRLYPATSLTARGVPLFDALCRLSDTLRLRWRREDGWLQFRKTSYFHDRLKEVPNRLLHRWAASRREHGALTLDDLCEIASLSPAQLDAHDVAQGARVLDGLLEWELPHEGSVRCYLQHLAQFTPAQRRQMQEGRGLPFGQMTLAQQQGFLALAFGSGAEPVEPFAALAPLRAEDLAGASMRVDYTTPGSFEWVSPLALAEESPFGAELLLPRVRERTPEAALQAARRTDPRATPQQVAASRLVLTILYLPGPTRPLTPGGLRAGRYGIETPVIEIAHQARE